MGTDENRTRYDRSKLLLSERPDRRGMGVGQAGDPRAKRGNNKRTVDIREAFNGLMYLLSTGCQ